MPGNVAATSRPTTLSPRPRANTISLRFPHSGRIRLASVTVTSLPSADVTVAGRLCAAGRPPARAPSALLVDDGRGAGRHPDPSPPAATERRSPTTAATTSTCDADGAPARRSGRTGPTGDHRRRSASRPAAHGQPHDAPAGNHHDEHQATTTRRRCRNWSHRRPRSERRPARSSSDSSPASVVVVISTGRRGRGLGSDRGRGLGCREWRRGRRRPSVPAPGGRRRRVGGERRPGRSRPGCGHRCACGRCGLTIAQLHPPAVDRGVEGDRRRHGDA